MTESAELTKEFEVRVFDKDMQIEIDGRFEALEDGIKKLN